MKFAETRDSSRVQSQHALASIAPLVYLALASTSTKSASASVGRAFFQRGTCVEPWLPSPPPSRSPRRRPSPAARCPSGTRVVRPRDRPPRLARFSAPRTSRNGHRPVAKTPSSRVLVIAARRAGSRPATRATRRPDAPRGGIRRASSRPRVQARSRAVGGVECLANGAASTERRFRRPPRRPLSTPRALGGPLSFSLRTAPPRVDTDPLPQSPL
jgi:hypothetical protein